MSSSGIVHSLLAIEAKILLGGHISERWEKHSNQSRYDSQKSDDQFGLLRFWQVSAEPVHKLQEADMPWRPTQKKDRNKWSFPIPNRLLARFFGERELIGDILKPIGGLKDETEIPLA